MIDNDNRIVTEKIKKPLRIETERLIIRRFKKTDSEDLFEYLSDAECIYYEPYPPLTDVSQGFGEAVSRMSNEVFYAVCLKSTDRSNSTEQPAQCGKLIGNITLCPQDFDTYDLGYVFNRSYHGKGYATEAAKALVEYAFGELNAHRIVAYCNPDNTPSWRLMERLGMRREAYMRKNVSFKSGEDGSPIWWDSYMYAILSEEQNQ